MNSASARASSSPPDAVTDYRRGDQRVSDTLEEWLQPGGVRTVGGLIDLFGERSFAVLLIVLLSVPALPVPTGGATHVLEAIAAIVALQLLAGRREVWLPRRWRRYELSGDGHRRVLTRVIKVLRRLERASRPRLAFVFSGRPARIIYGLLVGVGVAGAMLAPPFTGLDTLPALGVVVLSMGVLLGDAAIALIGVLIELAGVALVIVLGTAAFTALSGLL